ncbi:hypothetical protein WR25_19044 [Diploscapter pachys]|uniref:Uncharacterized protein n=1 Tax=Diploscapter pachys TaxID=2018661 RepID=A0A2A2JJV8_9BILA|nr:hypothetical protein WR25_19044 [Diploscapter pachys]
MVYLSWPSEWSLEPDHLIVLGGTLQRLNLYPYFDAAHYALTCAGVRSDLGPTGTAFSRRHPFSCWLSSMIMSFAGSFLAGFLLGEPIIAPFKRHDDIILATIVWYFVFYSPFDVVYKLLKLFPIVVILSMAKEVQRTAKISQGIQYTVKLYPNSYLVQILVGVARGAGGGIVKIVEQLVRGSWTLDNHELMRPSFTTKASVIASLIFVLERHSLYVTAPHDLVYFCVCGFFVYFKLSSIMFGVNDALAPLENMFCAIFMGGAGDAFQRAVEATREAMKAGRPKSDEEIYAAESEKYRKQRSTQNSVNHFDKKNKDFIDPVVINLSRVKVDSRIQSRMLPDSFQLDQEILLDVGAQLHRLKMFPYFDIAHYILATITWYLVFYAPFDCIYKLSKVLPIKCVLAVMKEVKRAYKVSHGVAHAHKLYPNSYLVQILVGTAKGAGSGIIRTIEQLVRGVWLPNHNEVLRPSFGTKACLLASLVLSLEKNSLYVTAPHDLVYLGIVGFFVYFKLSAVILHVTDPFAPIENLFCAVFMGGIWDALSRALAAARDRRAGADANVNGSIASGEKKDQ